MVKTVPDFAFEQTLLNAGIPHIAGTDEAGRGPLAGPVVAAAVILSPDDIPDGLNDSKAVGKARRIILAAELRARADVGVGVASVREIEEVNILRASHLAMVRAIANLSRSPDHVLIDGNMIPRGLNIPSTPIVKGDARSLTIAAASIIAKTERDVIMVDLAQQHPEFGWETNAGYPTKSHTIALQKHGPTPHHRRTFGPVHKMLYQD